ncbi:MAG: T9SS type A sorting domain-containing protein, partial [Bacteroidota bacterium]
GSIIGPPGACANQQQVQYCIDPVAGATFYNWMLPTGVHIVSGQNTPCITVNFAGSYTGGNICLSVGNDCAISPLTCITIPLNTTKPSSPTGIIGSSDICLGTTEAYSITPIANATQYIWTASNGLIIQSGQGTTSINVFAPPGSSNGDIKVKASNCKGNSSDRSKGLKVKSLPGQAGAISGPASVCVGKSVEYKSGGSSGATSYVWNITDVSAIVNNNDADNDMKAIFVDAGAATVAVYGYNVCGLGPKSMKTVNANNCPRLSEDRNSTEQINVYPNPVKEMLTLNFISSAEQPYSVKIFDMTGRIVYQEGNIAIEGENQMVMNVSNLVAGIYMINLQMTDFNKQIRLMVE